MLPLWNAIELARLRGKSDTTIQLADWIEAESLGEQDLIFLSDGLDVPLFYGRNDLGQNRRQLIGIRTYPWFRYQDRIPTDSLMEKAYPLRFLPFRDGDFLQALERDPGTALLSLKPRYVAVVQFYSGEIPQHRSAVRTACVALAERVEIFSPHGRGNPPCSPLTYQDSRVSPEDPIFLRIHRAQALGPVIEVYRFEP